MINLGNWSLRNMRSADVDVWTSDPNIVWNRLYSTMKPVHVNAIPRSTTGTRSSVKHSMIERGIHLLAPADVLKSFTFTTDMVSKIWVQLPAAYAHFLKWPVWTATYKLKIIWRSVRLKGFSVLFYIWAKNGDILFDSAKCKWFSWS